MVLVAGVRADERADLPKDVPPVVGVATVLTPAADNGGNDWSVRVVVPRVVWEKVGQQQPKVRWPKLRVSVTEAILDLSMHYSAASQLSEQSQNRVLDLKGRRLSRQEALRRLQDSTPVLVSVSGTLPDAWYLRCTKPDTLIIVPGIPNAPAPELLPRKSR
ncbi:MAG: hypothetical protein NXI04_24190 [Planctomycetaceae bacterium]|nr:hypothetical protein [Planctomycetaceae bacterium]